MVHSDHEDSCELLGAPVRLPFSGKTARNRIWKSGMTERLSTFSDSDEMERGRPTSSYQRLYSVFGSSGAGRAFSCITQSLNQITRRDPGDREYYGATVLLGSERQCDRLV